MRFCVLFLVAACGRWSGVDGSGKSASETRPLSGFGEIDIAGPFQSEIAIAAHRVELSGDDNLLPLIESEVKGNALVVQTRKSLRPKQPLVARISAPQISAVAVTGSGTTTLRGMQGDKLTLRSTGDANITGNGTVRDLTIHLTGDSKVALDQLSAENVTLKATGDATVEVAASRSLDVHITGSATVTYRGDPAITQDITGSGRLVKR